MTINLASHKLRSIASVVHDVKRKLTQTPIRIHLHHYRFREEVVSVPLNKVYLAR